MKDKSKFETLLYSALGIAVLGIAVIAFNYIASKAKVRVDLTKEKLYTLSNGTRQILAKLDTPVRIRFYATRDNNAMPAIYSSYAQRVEDLLGEYRLAGNGKIEIEKLDPKPDTEAEESASLDGIDGQMVDMNDKIYLGIAVSCVDQKAALPFLDVSKEQLLEYEISRAITQVIQAEKPVVGVMSSLPVFGQANDPMAMMRGWPRGAGPWVFISELKRTFEVQQIDSSVESIDAKVKVLLLVHPKNLSDTALYAVDQFLLRGGKLIAFIDPLSVMDSAPGMNPLQRTQSASSSIDKLTKAWGLEFDSNKVLADMDYKTRINRGGRVEVMPAFLSLTKEGLNTNDVTTAQIDTVLIPFGGAITGEPVAGLKKDVLIKSSEKSQLVEKFVAEFSSEQTAKDFVSSGKQMAIAVRLTGKFKSAFPDGKPVDKKEDDKKDAAKPAGDSLKESKVESAVILVADTDMLADQFCASVQELPIFGRMVSPGPNLALVQNMVEQFAGDINLITVRSRATLNRPFTVVRKMEEEAEAAFRDRQRGLEKELQEAQSRLNELQAAKTDKSQRFILSPEQQQEIEKFKKRQSETKRELRDVRKQLRRSVESLQTRVKVANIALMPALVIAGGIALALYKRKQTAAR